MHPSRLLTEEIPIHLPTVDQDVVLRPMRDTPNDRDRARRAYAGLDSASRMNRFWSNNASLSEAMVDRLLQADQYNHVVWAALPSDSSDLPGIGAASYWRDPKDERTAEFSITVAPAFRRAGIGTMLLALLWSIARFHGIDSFVGHVRPENRAAIRWLSGLEGDHRFAAGEVLIHWPLKSVDELEEGGNNNPLKRQIAHWQRILNPKLFTAR